MGLSDRLAGRPPPPVKGPDCTVARLLMSLPPKEAAALDAALADSGWQAAAIEREAKAEGYRLPQATIQRHRRGLCKCRVDS